ELIQNADDAKAEEIIFDITDRGLLVRNSGRFTYCGDLHTRPCSFMASNNYSCDYHRIADVGSGGKLSKGENIGRFGIGFVSTYQVTDHPEIRSSGIKLTLHPEEGQWYIEDFDEPEGTSFFLPWAVDPNTEARLALGVSHVGPAHIDQLTEDFQAVLRNSLLFLRHVQKAEVLRNGQLLLACYLERGEGSDLIVRFRPTGEVEKWHILRTDAAGLAKAKGLFATHPRLEALNRSTKVSIALRIEPAPLTEGLLYAFLPTEQSTGLPLHINADFFPEPDRKSLIFSGHQHEQAWNEILVGAASVELAQDLEGLLKLLGPVQLWQIVSRAYELHSKKAGHPACFKTFWDLMRSAAPHVQIAMAQDGSYQRPSGVFLTRPALDANQARALLQLGGRLPSEDLRPFHTAMSLLGAPFLTLERLLDLLERATAQQVAGTTQVDAQSLESLYRPLWSIVNDLLPDAAPVSPITNAIVQRLAAVPFVLTEDLYEVTINQSYVAPSSQDTARVAELLPRLAIASHHLLGFSKLARLIRRLDLGAVTSHIRSECASHPIGEVLSVEPKDLRDVYALCADLDRLGNVATTVYQALRSLPIWLSSRGLISANRALLPGDFTDPTGYADLLDTAVLTESARDFLTDKLGVPTQTIEAFVRTVLPSFFNDAGPLDETKYARLITELANHTTLVNDESIRRLLGSLPIVPTQDGRWSQPTNTYRRTEELVKLLGEARHLWLDTDRLPNARSVQTFIDSLGIRRIPMARHLVDRMLFLANQHVPSEEARRASAEAFYVLCDNYEKWKDKEFFQSALSELRGAACFPALDDGERWHSAASLHAPYRAEAFDSQAKILDYRSMGRLKRELLGDLGVSLDPHTQLVIGHLRHCVGMGKPAPFTTYQILNERAKDNDPLIGTLAGEPFVFVEPQKSYVRSNQLFWLPQQLGRYAFTIPGNLESFKPLFTAIGVKNAPEGRDFSDILLDIVGECFEQSKPVVGPDRSVYDRCLEGLCAADSQDALTESDLMRLQQAPSILNVKGQPTHPDEVLLQDSEWHAGFFAGELDRALCKPAVEFWSFMQKLGVRRLSESALVALEYVDGSEVEETSLANKLIERAEILARLLHCKPAIVKSKIQTALGELAAVSHEVVRIQASVNVGGDQVFAPPAPVQAFYDIEQRRLILARPVGDRIWPHVLNALFHQLMPDESGSEISNLTLNVRLLMGLSVEKAHQELTDAGIPYVDSGASAGEGEDLTSQDLGVMGDASSTPEHEGTAPANELATNGHAALGNLTPEHGLTTRAAGDTGSPPQQAPPETPQCLNEASESPKVHLPDQPDSGNNRHGASSTDSGERRARKPRAKHKEQWDRRLLSYVRKKPDVEGEADADGSPSEHNLGVEVVARAAVCSYEKSRGRLPEQMAQTHPGYDIVSRNPLTGEERFIEVKGVNGEWNKTGVGLSRLQFSNAQDYGDRFWLYVVEFVGDPQHMRVHPIQSPATQVTSFMFDGNWRDAVADERADPALPFIAGAKVKHQQWGRGQILTMALRGSTRVMSIDFEEYGRRTVTLNLQVMSVVEDDDDNDRS
ncbi:MAG: DUF3883 domain-containing protein, partial [Fimbriimonadaceae bacterium]|nr:DUF3883 domain-containing protein [Fimbriimonadaceae bacterium]